MKAMFKTLFVFVTMTFGAMTASANDEIVDVALDNDIRAAITHLVETNEVAKELAATAKGALVFPNMTKAGFLVGVQYGNGALVKRKASGGYYISKYYNLKAASYGLQAGVQTFAYVMALMTDEAVEFVETTSGWELGVGPSIVAVDEGMMGTFSTTTAKSDIYAFTFGQKGLMAGLGIQGSKITRVNK